MNKMVYISLIFVSSLFATGHLKAQHTDSTTLVFLESNFQEALVFADSLYLGRANQITFNVPRGTKEMRLVPPEIGSWSVIPVFEPFEHSGRDTINLAINFPYYYKIESIPYEAKIFVEQPEGRSLLGNTPLLYTSQEPLKGTLLLAHDGFESMRLAPGDNIWNQHFIELSSNVEEGVISEQYWTPERSSKRWIDYTAAGVALVSGVLAIRYKTKANRRFNRYRVSGDPALRSGFERYDRNAAISLGAMQVGIGVLAVRFVIK